MKLKQYLNEIIDDAQINEIRTKCSDIIKIYKSQKILYRGTNTISDNIEKHKQRPTRKPKDTPQWAHDYLNTGLKKKFGWSVRNGLSSSTVLGQAIGYGTVFIVFPENGFKHAFLPNIKDMWIYLDWQMIELTTKGPHASELIQKLKDGDHSIGNLKKVKANSPYREAGLDETLDDIIKLYTDKSWKTHEGEVLINSKYYWMVNNLYLPKLGIGNLLKSGSL